jgi:hypothetical protein
MGVAHFCATRLRKTLQRPHAFLDHFGIQGREVVPVAIL